MSELYREKIESLQAEESRLLAQKAAAQSAAAETVRQAEKDGAALVSQAQEAARRAAADALRQAEAQAEAERLSMLDRTEKDCEALRAAAMARMDDAVDYLLKPFGFADFNRSAAKANSLYELRHNQRTPQEGESEALPKDKEYISVKADY